MATSAVGSTVLDTFRTFGTAVAQTKVVKDIAKVTKGLIDAGVFNNAQLKDSAPKIVGAIDFLEFGESISYVAKWIDPNYIPKAGEKSPTEESLRNNLVQVSLFFTRLFGFLKASDTYQLLTKADLRKVGEMVPVLRDHLDKVPAFDTLAGLFYLPFGGSSLYDNTINGTASFKLAKVQHAKITKWVNKPAANINPINLGNIEARREAKINQHTASYKLHRASVIKNVLGGASTTFKLTAASTAVVAALFFGGVAGVLSMLVLVGLAGNTLSLSKNFFEAYQEKYNLLLPRQEGIARAAAAAA